MVITVSLKTMQCLLRMWYYLVIVSWSHIVFLAYTVVMNGKHLTADEAATELGVSRSRVYALITAGKLKAQKFGRDWVIARSDLRSVRHRKPGRPKGK